MERADGVVVVHSFGMQILLPTYSLSQLLSRSCREKESWEVMMWYQK